MNSRVHPKYKTQYRVSNGAEYDRALTKRGDITLWISKDAPAAWKPATSGKRGGQKKFSDRAIETALTLRLIFKLPLRQAEGFLRSLLCLMKLDLESPDHTTLSRRSQLLDVKLLRVSVNEPIHLIVDRTGLSVVGKGEGAAAKHGGKGRRGWRKLHLGVDGTGIIVARALTDGNVDDASSALNFIDNLESKVSSLTADTAYDTIAFYEAGCACGADVIVPPTRTAVVSPGNPRPSARDLTIMRVKEIGRRRWKKESGYHRQGTVENAFFRYKSIIGDRLRARHPKSQEVEAAVACNILNRMAEHGRPASYAIGA
jgi:hypothetical protein